jgi:MFS family permease
VRPLAERHGHRSFVVPGALAWAGAYLWYHQQVGTEPAFWAEWLPGQVLGGIGAGATLTPLARAALTELPADRHAAGSAVIAGVRLLGGVLGIAGLAVVLGTPTASTVVPLREGWLLSVFAFLLVSLLALPLGALQPAVPEAAVLEVTGPRVYVPEQRDGSPEHVSSATHPEKGQPDSATSAGVPSPRGFAASRSASRAD